MKLVLSLLVLLALLSICHSQETVRGFNPQTMNGRNSPQLQLQYCLISNCRQHFDKCKNDESCFKLLRQCPPRSFSILTECFQVVINENKELSGLLGFYQCITDNCKSAQGTNGEHGEHGEHGGHGNMHHDIDD